LPQLPSRQKITRVSPSLTTLRPWIPIPGYENYISPYLVQSDRVVVVDTGPRVSVPNLIEGIVEAGVHPEEVDYIILTHIHMDHAGGIGTVVKEMKNARVVAHPRAKEHLIDPSVLWKASLQSVGELAEGYGMIEPVPAEMIIEVEEGMEIDLGQGMVMNVIFTPGHATHHLSVFERKDRVLFSGDAAGSYRGDHIRLSTIAPTRPHEYLASLEKLISLGAERIAYGHFGCYDGAQEKLEAVRKRFVTWYDTARMTAARGGTVEEAVSAVLALDETASNMGEPGTEDYQREYSRLAESLKWLMKTSR